MAEVFEDLIVGDVESRGQQAESLDCGAELCRHRVDHDVLDHLAEVLEFVGGEAFHQTEVEEGHVPVRAEQVVPRMRVAVERRQTEQAPEREPVQGLGCQIFLFLRPGEHFVPVHTISEFGSQHLGARELVEHLGHMDVGMAEIAVAEQVLIASFLLVVELFDETLTKFGHDRSMLESGEQLAESGEQQPCVVEVGGDRFGDARVLHLDRHRLTVVGHGPVDLSDRSRGDGNRIPFGEDALRWCAEFGFDNPGRQLRAHWWRVLLQLCQHRAYMLGQALIEIARHLPDLHERALHMSEGLGDLLGGAHLELGVELSALTGIGEHPAGPVGGVGTSGTHAEHGQPGVAARPPAMTHRTIVATPAPEPTDRSNGQRETRRCGQEAERSGTGHDCTLRAGDGPRLSRATTGSVSDRRSNHMIITTTQGQIEGIERKGTWQFRGIPYAAAPVGERRFMAPEPPRPWEGVRSGANFGAISWPEPGGVTALLGDDGTGADEDCLYLNVFTPDCDDAARPVMVWIHGGSFVGGSGSTPWYDGTSLATLGDVVVVTINYRLGALGFLWLGDLDDRYRSSGMNGILDQAAALAWVHENIAAFGGDPDNVTIFGESAGAMSVSTLLATPAARGLFHRAIAQSGAAEHVSSTTTAAGVAEAIMADLGLSTIDELLAVAPEALVAAGARVDGLVHTEPGRSAHRTGALAMIFQPVIDGEWLPEDPLVAVAQGRAADVPLLIGTNLDEWHLFRLMGSDVPDHDELLARMTRVFGDGVRAHESYSATRPEATPSDLWSAVLTDAIFRIPAIRLVEARENAASQTFQYLFSWPSSAFDGALGSCHALEIPFVFGVLGNPGAEMIFGGAASTELEELALQMQHAWLAFARTGDPGHDGLPHWPVANSTDRPAMRFDLTRELLLDHDGDERALWDGIL